MTRAWRIVRTARQARLSCLDLPYNHAPLRVGGSQWRGYHGPRLAGVPVWR